MASDDWLYSVTLLLHCDGVEGSTEIVDTSRKQTTITTTAMELSTSTKMFGSASARCVTDEADLLIDNSLYSLDLGLYNFTLELWFRVQTDSSFWLHPVDDSTATWWNLGTWQGDVMYWGNQNGDFLAGTTTIAADTWYHVAVCRHDQTTRLFLNGLLEAAHPNDNNNYNAESDYAISGLAECYFDEIRITPEIARYTSNFTTQTEPFKGYYDPKTDFVIEGYSYLNLAFSGYQLPPVNYEFSGTSLITLTASGYIEPLVNYELTGNSVITLTPNSPSTKGFIVAGDSRLNFVFKGYLGLGIVVNTGCNWATQTPFGCKVNRIVAGNNPPFKQAEWQRINGVDWVHYQAGQSRYNRVENIDFSLAGPLSSYQLRSWIAGHIMVLGQTENNRSGQLWPVYVNPWGG